MNPRSTPISPAVGAATAAVPLRGPTREPWTRTALADVDRLLDDHCQCELKAATNALALVGRNPERDSLVKRMSALAKEEMVHYRIVRQVLLQRGGRLSRPLPNPYMKQLQRDRRGGEHALLDDLVVAAVVEARSCERFVALAEGLRDFDDIEVTGRAELAKLYERLARSESGHARLFVDLAEEIYPAELVGRELQRRAEIEAEVLASIDVTPRMHGGHGR